MSAFTQSFNGLIKYLKNWFYQFLIVFFTNYLVPGIEIVQRTKLPHIDSDIWFAIVVGFVNSLIYPVLKIVNPRTSLFHIGVAACVIAMVTFTILKFAPLGIEVKTISGFIFASFFVAAGSFLLNFYKMKQSPPLPQIPQPPRI